FQPAWPGIDQGHGLQRDMRGVTHFVTLALRVLTRFDVWVRRGSEQGGEKLTGLDPGQAKRTTGLHAALEVAGLLVLAVLRVIGLVRAAEGGIDHVAQVELVPDHLRRVAIGALLDVLDISGRPAPAWGSYRAWAPNPTFFIMRQLD